MIELVMSYISQLLLVLAGSAAYVIAVALVLPHIFLSPRYRIGRSLDRGIKKYRIPGGRAIAFMPSASNRRYIKQYVLAAVDGDKHIVCKFGRGFASLHYTVTLFDADDRHIGVLDVRENVGLDRISERLSVPADTAYACVCVRSVNGNFLPDTEVASYPLGNVCAFFVMTVACTVTETLLIKWAVELLSASRMAMADGIAFSLIAAVAVGLVLAVALLQYRLTPDIKITKDTKGRK